MKTVENNKQLLNIRKNMQLCILQNPNYFGTIADAGLNKIYKPVYEIKQKNYYEELGGISYNPYTEKLNVPVILKHASGYLGAPCQGGSKEYVRFYVDYTNDGKWTDEGAVSVGVHDRNFEEELFYDVELKINPRMKYCIDKPVALPRVKVILSWNLLPPVNHPNWNVIWGDVKESTVQIVHGKNRSLALGQLLDPSLLDKMQVSN
jgi:hypothetical protein